MNERCTRKSTEQPIAASLPERLRAHADLFGVYLDTDSVVADLRRAAAEIDRLAESERRHAFLSRMGYTVEQAEAALRRAEGIV